MRLLRTISIVSTSIVAFCCTSCGVEESTLTKIAVTKIPDKTTYTVGETFDPKGMEITGYYAENKTALIKDYSFSPDGPLSTSNKTITIKYKKFTCTTKISVRNRPDPGDYYASITDDMTGSTLKNALQEIIKKNIQVSYDWSRYEAADQDLNNANNITTIYARTSLAKTAHVNNKNVGWNREHSIPNSKITGDPEKDNHIIFASDAKVNGARSNNRFAQLSGSGNVVDSYGNKTKCILSSKNGETFFDPGDTIARGMVARSTMYGYVLYGLSPTMNFDSISTMMAWHNQYPPEEVDEARNEAVFGLQRNRNPFVDHPEYAARIWG